MSALFFIPYQASSTFSLSSMTMGFHLSSDNGMLIGRSSYMEARAAQAGTEARLQRPVTRP